ncbi:unnamed protein product [Prunus armeniaca]
MFMSTLINEVNLIFVLCAMSLLVTLLLKRVISAYTYPEGGEKMSELESLRLENLGLELQNVVFEDVIIRKKTTSRTGESHRSPYPRAEDGFLCEEMTG